MLLKSFLTISLFIFVACSDSDKPTISSDGKWTTTPSGLQYQVVTEGSGESPIYKSTVTVNYVGQLESGKVFDKSRKPISFGVGQVIPGWTEGLQLMKPGATYLFRIPPNLAYGKDGMGPIPENATLLFEVELVSFK
jgi:FKBP-type peptidyl-prolyl cis-trans isomerase